MLTDDVASGDRLRALSAIRDRLATDLDRCEPRESASLARQLVGVLAEIDSLAPKKVSAVDDLAAKRATRRAKASS